MEPTMEKLQPGTGITPPSEDAAVKERLTSLRREQAAYKDEVLGDLEEGRFEEEDAMLSMEEAA